MQIAGDSFALIFLGMSFLAGQLGVVPDPTEQETVLSQITRTFVGAGSPFYFIMQIATAVILMLAANTSFADFPRLSNFLARDGFLPRIFQFRGERLAFNAGIILLATFAIVLIVAFGGIPVRNTYVEALLHSLVCALVAGFRRPQVVHIQGIGPALVTPVLRLLGLRVIVTHHGEDDFRHAARELGACGFVEKEHLEELRPLIAAQERA